jgi:hypothetical protein
VINTDVQIGTDLAWAAHHDVRVKKKDLTHDQVSSIPCPTCGVAAGKHCILSSGGLRFEPHLNRRLAAAGVVQAKTERKSSR